MCEVQKLLDGLCDTFRKSKEQRQHEMVQILQKVRCCDCGHQKRMKSVRKSQPILCGTTTTTSSSSLSSCSSSSSSSVRQLLLACFGLMILLCAFFIYLVQRYNHVRAYGSNACGSSFFYSDNDCDVIC